MSRQNPSRRRPADYEPVEGARFEVHFEKARGFYGDDAKPFEAAPTKEAGWKTRDLVDLVMARVMELTEEGKSVRDIADELQMTKSTVNRMQN